MVFPCEALEVYFLVPMGPNELLWAGVAQNKYDKNTWD